jgi:hypothetical protein
MSKETKPVLAWYMCNYELFGSDDKMLSYFEDDGLGEAQKFNRHKWYSRRIETLPSFVKDSAVKKKIQIKPWLQQPKGSTTCWIYSVLNGLITSEYFEPKIQTMVDKMGAELSGGGCLWIPRNNKALAVNAILKAYLNAKAPKSSGMETSATEIKRIVHEIRNPVSEATRAPGIAQTYITMILDFLDFKYAQLQLTDYNCDKLENYTKSIRENILILKAPKKLLSLKNFLQIKLKHNLCERLASTGFVIDHCVMRFTHPKKLSLVGHYATGIKIGGNYFLVDTDRQMIPYGWNDPDFKSVIDDSLFMQLPSMAFAYVVYVRAEPSILLKNSWPRKKKNLEPIISLIDKHGGSLEKKSHKKSSTRKKFARKTSSSEIVRTGPRGGKFVMRNGKKVYV